MTSWTCDADGSIVVSPEGEIDVAVAGELADVTAAAMAETPDSMRLVFDLREVTFMDSTGINCVVLALNGMQARSGEVAVVNASPQVARVIKLVGLDNRLAHFSELDAD